MSIVVRNVVDSLANSRGRTTRHIVMGLAITGGAVAISALLARTAPPPPEAYDVYSDYEELLPPEKAPPPSVFAMIWPPLFLALTLSGFRVWNARPSFARVQALALWGLVQALNTGWLLLSPRKVGGQLATGLASVAASLLYVRRARMVDDVAGDMVAPFIGWVAFARLLTEEIWRKKLRQPFP